MPLRFCGYCNSMSLWLVQSFHSHVVCVMSSYVYFSVESHNGGYSMCADVHQTQANIVVCSCVNVIQSLQTMYDNSKRSEAKHM